MGLILTVVLLLSGLFLSWLFTCVLVYLIFLCFGLSFNALIATGIWLCILVLKDIFGSE